MSPTIISKYMQKQLVKLFNICHSKMENAVPRNASVRYSLHELNLIPLFLLCV